MRCANCGYENDRSAKRCSMCEQKISQRGRHRDSRKKNYHQPEVKQQLEPVINLEQNDGEKNAERKKGRLPKWLKEMSWLEVLLDIIFGLID